MTTTKPPPEAALIFERRKKEGKSARELALATGGRVSPTYWRNVERGGSRASAEVLARMAAVLWITPGELAGTGRDDAAAELERQLDTGLEDTTRQDVRSLVEKIARSRRLSEREKRLLAERIMNEITELQWGSKPSQGVERPTS